jgi:hypothetical protein
MCWDRQKMIRLEDSVLGITARPLMSRVPPGCDPHADCQSGDVVSQRDDLPAGFMARLARRIRIGQGAARKHGFPSHQMEIPMGAGGDAFNFNQYFTRTGYRDWDFVPNRLAG